jgi:hypothetical protein
MALDPQARDVRIPYEGGSVSMTRGLAEAIFGTDFAPLETAPVETAVSVRGHERVRVIGGDATTVNAYNYTFNKYPTTQSGLSEGGEPVMVTITDGSSWTARVSGPLNEFATFLANNTTIDNVFFKSQRGTNYGPFAVDQG